MDSVVLKALSVDWYGAKVPGDPKWGLEIKNGFLTLKGAACAPPMCVEKDREGAFVEGLWEGDVIELFLLNPQTGFYVEFNLGPRGGWWHCAFNFPRKRVGPLKRLFGVRTHVASSQEPRQTWENGTSFCQAREIGTSFCQAGEMRDACTPAPYWQSVLMVPLTSLPSELAFDVATTRGNVTFCIGKPQQFITLADLGGGEPDFHRPDRWIALKKML